MSGAGVSINDMTNPGIYRFYVNAGTDNANYLGWTGRSLVLCSGNCAGFVHQIFYNFESGYCAIRRNVTQGNCYFDYNVPLRHVDAKAEIAELNNRITALENLVKTI